MRIALRPLESDPAAGTGSRAVRPGHTSDESATQDVSGVLARVFDTPSCHSEPNGIADRATVFAEAVVPGSGIERGDLSDDDDQSPLPRREPYRAGDVIAQKYQLLRVLSRGGMGSVWVARNLVLDVDVALKLIRHDIKREGLTERLTTEARLAARIEHPAIITVFDLGHTECGDPYIVMELLRGEDLRDLLSRERRLGATRSVQLLLPIAEALATAHSRGIVHRDLKPENVFIAQVDQRLQPKLVDFGIAKPSWPSHRRLTRDGIVMGSPEYMAPEQAMGRLEIDQRADIWSFCIVLYECLTGRPPFSGDNYEATLRAVIEKPVRPISEYEVEDPELWAILQRGLSKHAEERWQSMRELGRVLAQWLSSRFVEDDASGHSLRATWLKLNPVLAPAADAGRALARTQLPDSAALEAMDESNKDARGSLPRWTAYAGTAAAALIWSLFASSWSLVPRNSTGPLERAAGVTREQGERALLATTASPKPVHESADKQTSVTTVTTPNAPIPVVSSTPRSPEPARRVAVRATSRSGRVSARTSLSPTENARSSNFPSMQTTSKPATSRRMTPAELEFGF